jgi:hypothetical protein
MPKLNKGEPQWKDLTPPQTLLQVGGFIDSCTKWLVHEPQEVAIREFECKTVFVADDNYKVELKDRQSVFAHTELNTFQSTCFLCSLPSSHLILANPLTQRCFLFVCTECVV